MTTEDKRPAFGNRQLTDPDRVFEHNAWDNVEWSDELEEEALQNVKSKSQSRVPEDVAERLEREASAKWDEFYNVHQNRFFKDRQWLFTEFPELLPTQQAPEEKIHEKETDASYPGSERQFRILEVGCGVGNTLFPLVTALEDHDAFVYGCDFSSNAVAILKEHPSYSDSRCHAFVHDVVCTDTETPMPFPKASLDVVVLIFVLSAIRPDRFQDVITNLAKYLRPGGVLVLRDYGRYDMAQMRFNEGRCLDDNFYMRGDGTRVYFFTQDELHSLCEKVGLEKVQNYVDRRLQVNRRKQLKMYRVWIQCKYRKPRTEPKPSSS